MNKKQLFLLLIVLSSVLVSVNLVSNFVSAADCWSYTTQTTCDADSSCNWKIDSYSTSGGWCQELTCWSFYNQSDCDTIPVTGKNCTWRGGGTTYSCKEASCWLFDGTNETYCVNNSAGLGCQWRSECYSSGYGTVGGVSCWDITNEETCLNLTGCSWGTCMSKSCYDYTAQETCGAAKDWNGNNCTWEGGDSGWCTENGCWRYYNETACNAVTNLDDKEDTDCAWKWNSCYNVDCWLWEGTNESACVSNSANISCNWDGKWCNKKSCYDYNQANCFAHPECVWDLDTMPGMCEEINCWSWDSWKGGSKSACDGNSSAYGLGCVWEGNPPGDEDNGWCYKDISISNCSDFTTERQCWDTYWCWWEYDDWSVIGSNGTCTDPEWGGSGFGTEGIIGVWNPGCYIFNENMTNCGNVTGCSFDDDAGTCNEVDVTGTVFAAEIQSNGLNCSLVNESSLCSNIPMLATCCSWQNGTCQENKMSTSCWDQMATTPEGASFCEDYNAYTDFSLCMQISGDPWYMPCKWNNDTERCGFNVDKAFGNASHSLVKIDNQKNCEAAGGKWIIESYCEGNRSVPSGRCEYKCDEETNCDKTCFACESFDSSGSIVNASNAESACKGSALGYCEYTADTSAPNGIGYCKAKSQFKKGVASSCNTNCGDCTYVGDLLNNDSTKRPDYICNNNQKANKDGGGCKWASDNSTSQGGYCINRGELICQDTCDRCYTETDCVTIGAENKRNTTFENSTSCEWDKSNDVCSKKGEKAEICWDGIDNNNDGSIDCGDSYCYSDTYCGFVSGDCFIWKDNDSCAASDCEWVVDNWGAWCDFKGASCWKNDWNVTACEDNKYCVWSNDTYSGSSGWCEQDWGKGDACMGSGSGDCLGATGQTNNCTWTNDTWCASYPSNETSWCLDFGGWCDYSPFAPKNCWLYDSNRTSCQDAVGCNWSVGGWFEPYCSVDWSGNCWNYWDQGSCAGNGCRWKNYTWGGNCDHNSSYCYDHTDVSSCEAETNFRCSWLDYGGWGYCTSSCYNDTAFNSSSECGSYDGCIWVEESGWCSEIYTDQIDCWNSTLSSSQGDCDATDGCRWKNPGWCDPVGFSGGAAVGALGYSGGAGDSCFKYDGNKTLCANSSIINMSCGWMDAYEPFCDADWSKDCWKYYENTSCVDAGCYWFNGTDDSGAGGDENSYCMNPPDICWKNATLMSDQNECNENIYCNWSSWGNCQSTCFKYDSMTSSSECNENFGCRWVTGWCNSAGTASMFSDMQEGQHVELGADSCGDLDPIADICGYGMKDMGNSYGFGINVVSLDNSSICNKEKLRGGAFGIGNETTKFFYYLDVNGNSSGGCRLTHNDSSQGFEFMFTYESEWNETLEKAEEMLTAFKCKDSRWEGTDVKLSVLKAKMCGEIGGGMVAVEKSDLERFPTLYDSTKDIRVAVATANKTTNMSYPLDSAGGGATEGWTSPEAIDFQIDDMFSYGADSAKFEDVLRRCFTSFEDCYNNIDDDEDGLVDCGDYDCKYLPNCNETGVNAVTFVDTSAPGVSGAKIEEYHDSALIMFDTTKPANGTLYFYENDSACKTLNATIHDPGILWNDTVREFRTTHRIEIYNDSGDVSLNYNLTNGTTYYYKLFVCDESGRCGQSKCSSFVTASNDEKCSYCDFVTKIQAPDGWDVNYDLDQDGSYEHVQGKMCGRDAGLRTNYTDGRSVDILLNKTDGSVYIEFINASLTKTGLNSKTRNVTGNSFRNGTTTDTAGATVGYVGMISETRDKIVNNLHPEVCKIRIEGKFDELWHCDDGLNASSCANRTAEANLTETNDSGTGYRIWTIPFCEFSVWSGGRPGTSSSSDSTASGPGGGGGSGGAAGGKIYILTSEQFAEGYTKEVSVNDTFKFTIGNETHAVFVDALTAESVTITVSSESKQVTMKSGDEKKFELTDDNYYDLSVKLNRINVITNKAEFTIKAISEEIPEEKIPAGTGEVVGETERLPEAAGETNWILWILVVIAIVGAVALIIFKKKRK